ncbi:tRNA glutamyl-Q(34) synthetase GluQRS [Salinisphaera hydrothermalis]|uniref:tRNA glutamyl-Q(34) synthetase GluQRS n=1 Tax=Salinisphaera hydrothermalis TaxID=563188 RepID=UPI0033412E59
MTQEARAVIGRYAPSPTGPLHFGSLIAALASFCQARGQGGRWLLRIDDLDHPRVVAGAERAIRDTLADFGLVHDGPVLYQSERRVAYAEAVEHLKNTGFAFDCGCTRREARDGPVGLEGPIYPGTCRNGLPPGREARSVRLRVQRERIELLDHFQGRYGQDLAADIGDFVIRRADGITAYQLATVLDDQAQGVTDVIRGADLLSSTPRQIWIHRCLGWAPPTYGHIPVVVDADGEKLGKSTGALALDPAARQEQLIECLAMLGQMPPASLETRSVPGVLRWAVDNWEASRVPRRMDCRRLEMPGAG